MNFKSVFLKTALISGLIFVVGGFLNDLVEFVNGQFMPVYDSRCPAGKVVDFTHICASSATHLKFLSDWIPVNIAETIYSPGDVLMIIAKSAFIPAIILYLYFLLKER